MKGEGKYDSFLQHSRKRLNVDLRFISLLLHDIFKINTSDSS